MNLTSAKMDQNNVVSSAGGKSDKNRTENIDFADFSAWNVSSEIKPSSETLEIKQTPVSSKPKLKSGQTPSSSKLKKKKSVKKTTASRKKTISSDHDGSREVSEDERHDSVKSGKPKRKKGPKKKSPKDSDSGEKSNGKSTKKRPGIGTHLSKSQAMLEVEGSVSSALQRDLISDLDSDHESALTDSVQFSDSSLQLNDSDASSMFIDDPYAAADSSEDDAAMLFLPLPVIKGKGKGMTDSTGMKGETKVNKVDERNLEGTKKETAPITKLDSKNLADASIAVTAVSVAVKPPPVIKALVAEAPSINPLATKAIFQEPTEQPSVGS
jgi:hypothetical protein